MVHAIKERVTVGPGGRIQIEQSALPEGRVADVIVLVDDSVPPPGGKRLVDYLGAAKGMFASGEEADAFLRAERDAWEQ